MTGEQMIDQLTDLEGEKVTLCFTDRISVPTEKYNGHSYSETRLEEWSLPVTINMAELEDGGITFICLAEIDPSDAESMGIDLQVVEGVEIIAGRDSSSQDAWPDVLEAKTSVQRTKRAMEKYSESGQFIQYAPPDHTLGEIEAVVKR